tara:strand:+ start:52 stop:417 length:366 start_codon:yes stop_codon:yes gene_type:complete
MATRLPIFEQSKLNGVSQFLLQNGDTIHLKDSFTDEEAGYADQVVAIIDIHWTSDSTGMVITYGDTTTNDNDTIQLYGNGAWARTNGFYPIASDANISVAGNGTVQILVKKVRGYAHRDDR